MFCLFDHSDQPETAVLIQPL